MAFPKMDYRPGLDFQALVQARYGKSVQVSSPSSVENFFLVVSFSRSLFHLDSDSVALVLQSVLGGNAPNFRVIHEADRTYRFSVVNKSIGLMIHRLSKFAC
ncbi:unnamed protein product [Urochloa humidicola]